MSVARLAGRCPGVSTVPDAPFRAQGWYSCWSGGVGQRGDPCPGGYEGVRPGPGRGDLEVPAAAAAGQAGGGVEQSVAQGPGLGAGQVAVQGDQLEPGDQGGGDPASHAPLIGWECDGSLPMPVCLPVLMPSSTLA